MEPYTPAACLLQLKMNTERSRLRKYLKTKHGYFALMYYVTAWSRLQNPYKGSRGHIGIMGNYDNETLVLLIQSGQGDKNELLTELWEKNLRLIRKIILQLTGLDPDRNRQDFEDLEQQAFLGILDAINGYNYASGYKFFTYAVPYIRKSIFRFYDRAGQTIRIPEFMQTRIRKYLRVKHELECQGKRSSGDAIKEHLCISEKAFVQIEKTIQHIEVESLDSYLQDNDPSMGTLLDVIEGNEDTEKSVVESIYEKELHEILRKAINQLPDQDREIINLYTYQGWNYESIANIYGITKQAIGESMKRSYKRIRTGKYGQELVTFLPEHSAKQGIRLIEKEIDAERLGISEKEKDLLI